MSTVAHRTPVTARHARKTGNAQRAPIGSDTNCQLLTSLTDPAIEIWAITQILHWIGDYFYIKNSLLKNFEEIGTVFA
jgi:hypothetical protein